MDNIETYLSSQYELVRQSRATIFAYCHSISKEDFINENNSFGNGGSIRNLLVHVANSYQFWILKNAMNRNMINTENSVITSITDAEKLYHSIDVGISEFIDQFKSEIYKPINLKLSKVDHMVTPMEIFTHVITHEFHHKGQILSLSRHLGYTPIDSDIIRFS